jgi:hypothetical protein
MARKTTLDKHLTSKLQVSPNFTLDSVADSNYRGKCDISGFLIFEWTLDKMDERDMKEEGKEKGYFWKVLELLF